MSSSSSDILGRAAKIAGISAWVVLGFFAVQFLLLYVIQLLVKADIITVGAFKSPLTQLIVSAIAYTLALVFIILPYLIRERYSSSFKKLLGIHKQPLLRNLGWVLLGYGAYLALSLVFAIVIKAVWPGFDAMQAQEIGFKGLHGPVEFAMALLALVVIAPIVEELLFRGFLFGQLRRTTNFWLSTLITSLVFGFVHLQWNVGVDVFALSLVLCFLREKTGTIWVGIALHMVKNSIAFTFLGSVN